MKIIKTICWILVMFATRALQLANVIFEGGFKLLTIIINYLDELVDILIEVPEEDEDDKEFVLD